MASLQYTREKPRKFVSLPDSHPFHFLQYVTLGDFLSQQVIQSLDGLAAVQHTFGTWFTRSDIFSLQIPWLVLESWRSLEMPLKTFQDTLKIIILHFWIILLAFFFWIWHLCILPPCLLSKANQYHSYTQKSHIHTCNQRESKERTKWMRQVTEFLEI